jgi:hypothetical protein
MKRQDEIYVSGYEGYDQLEPAESLAGDIGDDPLDAGYSPPDHEPALLRRDLAGGEQGESLAERLAAELPDVSERDLDRADEDDRAGRIVTSGSPYRETVYGRDLGTCGWASSAEEAAMHIVDR